jgi:BMFP domain-containing protein YqiC
MPTQRREAPEMANTTVSKKKKKVMKKMKKAVGRLRKDVEKLANRVGDSRH